MAAGRKNRWHWRLGSRLAAVIPVAGLLMTAQAGARSDSPIVRIGPDKLVGGREGELSIFRGIPYASPPIGDLRWREPQLPTPWNGLREAVRFAPDCPGTSPLPKGASEDCLYLNVWTPKISPKAKLPVMVWIYGGAFRGGSAADPRFDGSNLARRGVVLVSFGFRVGPLGYLATRQLSAESPHGTSGNYGVLDAIAALRWVRANIAAFGGDPRNVTIFGQSSGSETVNILTASPLARGLFHRAIGESGSSIGVRQALPLAQAEVIGELYMKDRGAADLAGLRALPLELVLARDSAKYEPNIDGWLLPRDVLSVYRESRQNDCPMLVGSNGQEVPADPTATMATFRQMLQQQFGSLTSRATDLFAVGSDEQAMQAQSRLTRILWGDFPAAAWVSAQAATGRSKIYHYLFDYAPPREVGKPRVAYHGAEIGYVFGTYRRPGQPPQGLVDDRMAELVQNYWVNFARTGNPNGPGLPDWPAVTDARSQTQMRFDSGGAAAAPWRDPALIALLAQRYYGGWPIADQRRLSK